MIEVHARTHKRHIKEILPILSSHSQDKELKEKRGRRRTRGQGLIGYRSFLENKNKVSFKHLEVKQRSDNHQHG